MEQFRVKLLDLQGLAIKRGVFVLLRECLVPSCIPAAEINIGPAKLFKMFVFHRSIER